MSEAGDDESIIGDMAHIIARKETFTRGDFDSLTEEQRDKYANLILLCKIHHKQIDDQPLQYTVEHLHDIKKGHEAWVKQSLAGYDVSRQRDDEAYADIVQEFCARVRIDDWTAKGTWICSPSGPQMSIDDDDRLSAVSKWIISRYWPRRYSGLESAFFNFKAALQDFLDTFHRHAERVGDPQDWLITKSFYKIDEWDPEKYERLYKRYDAHICLANDLFFELTRALNYVVDKVREYLLPSFRSEAGLVLVERSMVRGSFGAENVRVEYRGPERTEFPYPGLEAFRTVRYERDYHLVPDSD